MTIFRQCAPLVALLLVASAVEPALAQERPPSDAPPVRVLECKPDAGTAQTPTGNDQGPVGASVRIRYVNSAVKRAKAITFGVFNGSGEVARVEDRGEFSSGAQIIHDFALPTSAFPIGAAHCAAVRVIYDDGSTWSAAQH